MASTVFGRRPGNCVASRSTPSFRLFTWEMRAPSPITISALPPPMSSTASFLIEGDSPSRTPL